MSMHKISRWLLMVAAAICFSLPSHAGVFISVGFAPPAMPVYEQPPCPGPDMIWTPGYWAYGPDGYYWVPGAWVPAPYQGALWTPGYWGWENNLYAWHPGYWGPHVGYYGGVNYGGGYFGVGFVGGEWREGGFFYNTAVVHVDLNLVHHHGFEDRHFDHAFVDRNNHAAFSGGPGGIRHEPLPMERMAEHERHQAFTPMQQQHEMGARGDHGAYFRNNGGHPQNMFASHPLGGDNHGGNAAPGGANRGSFGQPGGGHGNNYGQPEGARGNGNAQPGGQQHGFASGPQGQGGGQPQQQQQHGGFASTMKGSTQQGGGQPSGQHGFSMPAAGQGGQQHGGAQPQQQQQHGGGAQQSGGQQHSNAAPQSQQHGGGQSGGQKNDHDKH